MHNPIRNFRITAVSILVLYFLIYMGTMDLDLLDIDSSQYGEIVREMTESGNYFRLSDNGRKYLDKPILTFWIIAPFFQLLGPTNYAYRLPSLIFLLLGTFALFRMVYLVYQDERRSWIAALLYMGSPGTYAMVLDPKIDIYLTSFLIFTHLFYFLGRLRNPVYYYFMYLSVGLGFITKGPISLVIPALSIGGDILIRRDWKLLQTMKIPEGIFLASLFPAIWSYLLYREFSTYGPAFFLWIQSFGRFYKDLYDEGMDPFFFFGTFLWAFGGFGLFFFTASIQKVYSYLRTLFSGKSDSKGLSAAQSQPPASLKGVSEFSASYLSFWDIIQKQFRDLKESPAILVFGLWVYLYLFLISFSRFHLPQYIYWILPGAAVVFSGFLIKKEVASLNSILHIFYSAVGILFVLLGFVFMFVFYGNPLGSLWIPALFLCVFLGIYIPGRTFFPKGVLVLLGGTAVGFSTISFCIYPDLLQYQPARKISEIVLQKEPKEDLLFTYRISNSMRSYAFYSRRKFRNIYDKNKFFLALEKSGSRLVVVPQKYFPEMQKFLGEELEYDVIRSFPSAKLAVPKPGILVYSKREAVLENIFLVAISRK